MTATQDLPIVAIVNEPLYHYELYRDTRRDGGFSYVYEGRDLKHHKPIAFKMLRDEYASNDAWAQQFADEARNIQAIKSRHVIEILRVLPAQTTLFKRDIMVMPWLQGESLDRWRLNRQPSLEEILPVARGVVEGVRAVHRSGIAHHDIKPDNVIITGDGTPVLIDFGLAWHDGTGDSISPLSDFGAAFFLVPEQINDHPQKTQATDIYALGVLLFYLFSGKHYLLPDAFASWMTTRIDREIAGIRQAVLTHRPNWGLIDAIYPPGIAGGLRDLLAPMLHKNPADRPDIRAVGRSLGDFSRSVMTEEDAAPAGPPALVVPPAPVSAAPPDAPKPTAATPQPPPPPPATLPGQPLPAPVRVVPDGPGDYRLFVLRQEGTQVLDLPEMRLTYHEADGQYRSGSLYLLPEQDRVQFAVIDGQDQLVYDRTAFVRQSPFEVAFTRTDEGALRLLESDTISLTESLDLPQPALDIRGSRISEILLLVDLSLGDNLKHAADFVTAFAEYARLRSHPLAWGALLYGEYHFAWMVAPSLLHLVSMTESSSVFMEAFQRNIEKPQVFRKGNCGALEYGLTYAAHGSAPWLTLNSARHLLVIGASPPHPTAAQRESYQLLEHTVDELPHAIDWQAALRLLDGERIQRHAMPMPPNAPGQPDETFSRYAQAVWQAIDGAGAPLPEAINDAVDTLWQRVLAANPQPYALSGKGNLPFIEPLRNPYPVKKGTR